MITGSKKEILDLLKRKGILSIDEVTDQLELAKTTLREHFLQLERDGYIERKYERSGPGRPSLQYQLTKQGHRLYPSGESALMRNFLSYLKKKGEESTIEDFFEEFWDKRYEKADRLMKEHAPEDRQGRLDVLSTMLEEEGFMPEYTIDEEQSTINIRECNCPFQEVVKETRLPCRLEADFYGRLFEGDVERTSYIADGDSSCTYCIAANNN
ncbi:MAG: DeoR family transcriptional regulator [Balneolaceae bacterium]|nr:DeoR family transcriptional regulator [Balneolaceae bacterium]